MCIKKVAFVCPIYPPHFDFAKSLLFSFKENNLENQSDLWFVFTSSEEAEEFGNYDYKLVLPEENRVLLNNGIINIKKIWAVGELQFRYKYIITLDSESLFIREVDLSALCDVFFSDKVLLGNKILSHGKEELTENIKSSCKEFFSSDIVGLLDSELYLWFNQPCIYKTSNLNKFFELTQINKKLNLLNWYHFDYYVYMYFLVIYENFIIVDMEIESMYGVCEATSGPLFIKSNKYEQLKIMISSYQNLKLFDQSSLFLVVQLDKKSSTDSYYIFKSKSIWRFFSNNQSIINSIRVQLKIEYKLLKLLCIIIGIIPYLLIYKIEEKLKVKISKIKHKIKLLKYLVQF